MRGWKGVWGSLQGGGERASLQGSSEIRPGLIWERSGLGWEGLATDLGGVLGL